MVCLTGIVAAITQGDVRRKPIETPISESTHSTFAKIHFGW